MSYWTSWLLEKLFMVVQSQYNGIVNMPASQEASLGKFFLRLFRYYLESNNN